MIHLDVSCYIKMRPCATLSDLVRCLTLGGCGLGNRRLQIDRSGPFFTGFLPELGYWAANPAKTGLAGADFGYAALRERFRRSKPDSLLG
ncbi:MAG TPA: hypothetical protein PLB22_09270 [Ottowia sp.]|nr:hypothetical protein [Ottowia sp.]